MTDSVPSSTTRASFVATLRALWRERKAALAAVGLGLVVVVAFALLIGLPPLFLGLSVLIVLAIAVWALRRSLRRTGAVPSGWGTVGTFAATAAIALVVMQAVPYGRDHTNPPVVGEPEWATPETRELMVRACFACHSNEVEHPWYSNVAPMSWAVQSHVDEGRGYVNYSEFTVDPGAADESVEVILDGSMPPGYFTLFGLNSTAVLTEDEKATLIAGLRATPGLSRDSGE